MAYAASYPSGRATVPGNAEPTPHDPALADLRDQVVERLRQMNSLHTSHVWERRHRDPIAAHAIAFFYADTTWYDNDQYRYQLYTATRLFLDGPETAHLPRLLYDLAAVARRAEGREGVDPRASMATRTERMGPRAFYIGLGISTLDTHTGRWTVVREQIERVLDVPGRCLAQLIDGTRIICARRGENEFGKFTVQSTHSLDVKPGIPSRHYTIRAELPDPRDDQLTQIWPQLERLHLTIKQAQHAP